MGVQNVSIPLKTKEGGGGNHMNCFILSQRGTLSVVYLLFSHFASLLTL